MKDKTIIKEGEKIKIMTVGKGGSGKTCLLITYTSNQFPTVYVPTIFDNYMANVKYGEANFSIEFWDTAGGEDYHRLRPLSYPETSVFLICFSVHYKNSFDAILEGWYPEIREYCPHAKIILVGTKHDTRKSKTLLKNDYLSRYDENGSMNFVTSRQIKEVAKKVGAYAYVECSALNNFNVKEVFDTAIRAHFGEKRESIKKSNSGILSSLRKKMSKLHKTKIVDKYDDKLVISELYTENKNSIFAHSAVYLKDKIYIFGGYKDLNNTLAQYPVFGSTDINSGEIEWKNIEADQSVFSPRSSLCAVVVNFTTFSKTLSLTKPRILLFGGKSNGYHDDLILVDPESNKLSKIEAKNGPSPRYGMTGVAYNNEMYIFGGYDNESSACNDCYKFNLVEREWSKLNLTGDIPSPRYFHTAIIYKNLMIIYGGKNTDVLDDMYSIDLVSGVCKRIIPVQSENPGSRHSHSCVYIGRGNMVLIGGLTKNKALASDIYIFSLETLKWDKLLLQGPQPSLYFHSSIYFEAYAEIWISGGLDEKESFYFTKLKIAKNTPRIYDVLPKSNVRDILSLLSMNELYSLSLVNHKFNKLATETCLWEPFAREMDPEYNPKTDGDPIKFMASQEVIWYNDFQTKPVPPKSPYVPPIYKGAYGI